MGMPQIAASTARRSSMRCWSSSEEKSFADTFSASMASVASIMSLVAFIVLPLSCLRFPYCFLESGDHGNTYRISLRPFEQARIPPAGKREKMTFRLVSVQVVAGNMNRQRVAETRKLNQDGCPGSIAKIAR